MNKEEIERQLKLSKRQNKDKRYDYLDSEFNVINYCMKLEKYISGYCGTCTDIDIDFLLDKMQELEKGE